MKIYMVVKMENEFNCDDNIEDRVELLINKDRLDKYLLNEYELDNYFINDEDGLILDEDMNEVGLYIVYKVI